MSLEFPVRIALATLVGFIGVFVGFPLLERGADRLIEIHKTYPGLIAVSIVAVGSAVLVFLIAVGVL